jgi:hypothetical protein
MGLALEAPAPKRVVAARSLRAAPGAPRSRARVARQARVQPPSGARLRSVVRAVRPGARRAQPRHPPPAGSRLGAPDRARAAEAPDQRIFEGTPPAAATDFLDALRATLCVDENRLFGIGNGSGGRFMLNWLATRDRASAAPRLRAAAMVGTYSRQTLGSPLPLIFLHSLESANSRAVAGDVDGTRALATLKTFAQCGDSTTPVSVEGCQSQGMTVIPGCVDYAGCAEPFRFCHHDSPDQVGDPWPCFGTRAILQFFEPFLAD